MFLLAAMLAIPGAGPESFLLLQKRNGRLPNIFGKNSWRKPDVHKTKAPNGQGDGGIGPEIFAREIEKRGRRRPGRWVGASEIVAAGDGCGNEEIFAVDPEVDAVVLRDGRNIEIEFRMISALREIENLGLRLLGECRRPLRRQLIRDMSSALVKSKIGKIGTSVIPDRGVYDHVVLTVGS